MEWHIITPEYPPQPGGVSDYTYQVAAALAEAGDEVHVWCPPSGSPAPRQRGVTVHPELGRIGAADLRRVGRLLSRYTAPRKLLVQWVPQGYGYRALNVVFPAWLCRRARRWGDRVELIVHEPFVRFFEGGWKHNAGAVVHRIMITLLLASTRRVWMTIPAWERFLRAYTFGAATEMEWLPVPSNIPTSTDPAEVASTRGKIAGSGEAIVGHFGTYGELVKGLLVEIFTGLLQDPAGHRVLLLGRRSDDFARELCIINPEWSSRIAVVADAPASAIATYLKACDLVIQPYADGISSRRTSAMAALGLGVPVVSTSGPFTEPIWRESGGVALYSLNDLPGLVGQALRLLEQPEKRVRLGERGAALYESLFSLPRLVQRLRESGGRKPSEGLRGLTAGTTSH